MKDKNGKKVYETKCTECGRTLYAHVKHQVLCAHCVMRGKA